MAQKNPQWMTNEIKISISRKKKAYNKYKKSNSDDDFKQYVITKRHCEREIRKSKRKLEINISKQSKTNPKMFYQYIRSKKTVKSKVGPIKDVNNSFVSDSRNMAIIFNNFFHSVFITEDTSSLSNVYHLNRRPEVNILKVDEIDVNDI